MIRVWDPFVRAVQWALAASFAVAWLSSENWESLHNAAGYAKWPAGVDVKQTFRIGSEILLHEEVNWL
jgi:cytochrome b